MRYLLIPVCLMLSVVFTGAAWADDDTANNDDRAGRRGEMRQKMLEKFDADGDGELSEDERATAREAMKGRRGDRAKGGKGKGKRAKGRRDGLGGPPDPGKLFDKYDADGDGQLSRAEFMKLAEEVRSSRGQGKRGGPRRDGPPRDGPPRDGPPRDGRRRFDRDRPLQNPGDRPGPPPRPEGRRGREGSGMRGPGAHGPRGHRPPKPAEVFERFDENGDEQLSREEFMKLADRMREMHERMGRGGERGMRGGRGGRGGRRGPPGDDGPPRPSRPPRPESDAGPELPVLDDDSV